MEPRILILTSNSYRQSYFANEIGKYYKLAGIVIEQKFSRVNRIRKLLKGLNYNPSRIMQKAYHKMRLSEIDKRYEETEMERFLGSVPRQVFPEAARMLRTNNINNPEVVKFIHDCRPNIILVSGPSLIRKEIIDIAPPKGIVNMHTGLSPYYRGGPCTFWCLLNEELEFLGVTIHYLTAGIDSGDIIFSERETMVEPDDNEATLDCKVIMRGVKLMIKAIPLIFENKAPRVPQWIKGRNYLYKDFTSCNRLHLERKLKNGLIKKWLMKNKDKNFDYVHEIG